ncbi:MAG: DUF3493 domain-containing protein [Cyanobacteria bacterium P01_F01_bin.33]
MTGRLQSVPSLTGSDCFACAIATPSSGHLFDMPPRKPSSLPFDERVRLTSELAAPYRKIRQFVYLAAALSGGLGGVIFFFRVIAGQDLAQTVPNLAIQLGVVAGALALSRWENGLQQKLERRVRARLQSEGKDKNA